MNTPYNRKERDAINSAWTWLEHLAELDSKQHTLAQALSYEKRHRTSVHCAKALMLHCWLQGREKPEKPVGDILMSWGCMWCVVFGAASHRIQSLSGEYKSFDDAVERLLKLAPLAHSANREHTKRLLASIDA